MVGTHGTVGTEGDLRDQDRHDGGGRSRSVALDRLTLAKNVRNLLFVRVGRGRYRDTGTEDVNSGEGRQGVVQGCRWGTQSRYWRSLKSLSSLDSLTLGAPEESLDPPRQLLLVLPSSFLRPEIAWL